MVDDGRPHRHGEDWFGLIVQLQNPHNREQATNEACRRSTVCVAEVQRCQGVADMVDCEGVHREDHRLIMAGLAQHHGDDDGCRDYGTGEGQQQLKVREKIIRDQDISLSLSLQYYIF